MTIRLVIADDHPVVLEGLRSLFSEEPDIEVLACAMNGEEALDALREHCPDVLVLDLRMPRKSGLEVLRAMREEELSARVVVLTAVDSDDITEAICLGADGVVLKDMATHLLVQCVRSVQSGGKWLEKTVAERVFAELLKRVDVAGAPPGSLTTRELAVARLVAEGMHNKAVARRLSITEGTAKLHLHHVYEKLELHSRAELMRYVLTGGLG
jgi:DNA-binding NarL/FixJ family response regulator